MSIAQTFAEALNELSSVDSFAIMTLFKTETVANNALVAHDHAFVSWPDANGVSTISTLGLINGLLHSLEQPVIQATLDDDGHIVPGSFKVRGPVPTAPFNFNKALRLLNDGFLVRRASWGSVAFRKPSFLFKVGGSEFKVNRAPLNAIFPEGTEVKYQPHIDIWTERGVSVWNPTQDDLFAEDYVIAEKP